MTRYSKQSPILGAVDCIIFGFDGTELKLLLIKRGFEPEKNNWSLMGGFVQPAENLEEAASRILKQLTGLKGVYMEQLHTFGEPDRDTEERTLSVAYFALIDIHRYEKQITQDFHPEWFSLKKVPQLIFDHGQMVSMARKRLQYKAALHPLLFELLPDKFTIPQLQNLYEDVYAAKFDKRNFSRKVLSTGLLIKQKDKEKTGSKKGAFFFKLHRKKYQTNFQAFLNIVPNAHNFI
jgi:8-oxo-dGTP diphosphatase